jgi:hypothetical protein
MRSEQLLRFVLVNGLAVGLGATVSTSCIKVNYPTVAFRCSPKQGENCPETHFCCSDDPSTANGDLPSYTLKAVAGGSTAIYADAANLAGTSGMCVRREDIPMGSGLLDPAALNCPIPCNPTWTSGNIAEVCGTGRVCCQTVELGDKDCVQDTSTMKWRPVTGEDIGASGVVPATNWNNVAHETHQDPNGSVCLGLNGNDPHSDGFAECIRHLTVANQRGFCMSLQAMQVCPTDPRPVAMGGAGYISACDRKNGMVPPV